MSVLVTGATGFVGSHLVDDLVKKGEDVKVLVRNKTYTKFLEELGVEPAHGDLLDKSSLEKAMSNVEVVYNFAGQGTLETPEETFWKVNVDGVRNVLEACLHKDVSKFIHCSTVSVLGNIKNRPINESFPYNPPNMPYAITKCEGEKLALKYANKLSVVVVRPSPIYGPPLMKKEPECVSGVAPILPLLSSIKEKKFSFVDNGQGLIHLVYIDDLVQGIELITKKGRVGEVYIIAGAQAITWKSLVEVMAKALGVQVPSISLPIAQNTTCPELKASACCGNTTIFTNQIVRCFMTNRCFDISKAKHELGYEPKMSVEGGMKLTVEWFEKSGYLENK